MPGIDPNQGISSSLISLDGMDLETQMMMVQSQRANLIEQQLKAQMESMQKKNEQISKLNDMLAAFNTAAESFPGDAKADATTKVTQAMIDSAKEAKIAFNYVVGSDITKGKVSEITQKTKSDIDTLTNNQQMDMLRLQSLNNKRNEAFDLMTNFIKKMQESRSSIIANMR